MVISTTDIDIAACNCGCREDAIPGCEVGDLLGNIGSVELVDGVIITADINIAVCNCW